MGWSAGLLAHEDGINDFGPRHRYLRPLGDGWQMVEIGLGWCEPPELGEPLIIEARAAYDRAQGKTGRRDADLRELTDLLTADRLMSQAAEDSAQASADRRAISGS